jgi:Flp pilus assembly protein CpaB
MADIGTMTTADRPDASGPPPPGPARRIRRTRGLPGSRAVVGALLVTAAAVGVFAAYLNATATPDTSYVVVQGDVPIGTVLTEPLLTDTTRFGLVAIDLPPELAANAVPADEALGLAGLRTTASLTAGDLLSRSALADASVDDDVVALSFEVDVARAVAGTLEPGERVDVSVTYGQTTDAYTLYVARNALLTDITPAGGGLEGEAIILTLSVPDDERVLALVQAFNTGQVVVSRAAAGAGEAGASVPAYSPPRTAGDADAVPSEPGAPAGVDDGPAADGADAAAPGDAPVDDPASADPSVDGPPEADDAPDAEG